jgi:hypothetical protein
MAQKLEDCMKKWPPAKGTPITEVFQLLENRISSLERRLLMIESSEESLGKYPALAEAYREYKIIERLTIGNKE